MKLLKLTLMEKIDMFNRILVPLDRSSLAECVLPHAIALARCLDAQLLLLHVLCLLNTKDRLRAVDSLEWQLRRAEAENYLKGVCARVTAAGVSCTTRVSDGDAAEQIVECASDKAVGLVLIASHGQSGMSAWHVSSVVQKVLVRARASLMIIRAFEPDQAEIANLHYQRVQSRMCSSAQTRWTSAMGMYSGSFIFSPFLSKRRCLVRAVCQAGDAPPHAL